MKLELYIHVQSNTLKPDLFLHVQLTGKSGKWAADEYLHTVSEEGAGEGDQA